MGTIQRQINMTSQILGPIIQIKGCFIPSNCFRYQRESCEYKLSTVASDSDQESKRGHKTFDFKEAVYVNMYIFDKNQHAV